MIKQQLTQLRFANYFTRIFFFGLFLSPSVLGAQSNFVCPAPADFNLITPCYVNGSRAINPNEDVIVLFNHAMDRGQSVTKQVIANYSEVGTVWGLAYKAQTKKLYAAAFLKRHCDLSPDGLGAIYEIDLTTPTTAGAGTPTLWMDLNTSTHLGAGATLFPTETAANRELAGINTPSHDIWAYTRVGKQGMGDIEITADGTTMYVMDLTNRQVLEINMATKTVTNRYAVNAPANYANAADRRPFGIKHHNGELYIGLVSSGETAGKKKDIKANVMKLSGSSFTSVYEVDSMAVEHPDHIGEDFWVTSYRGNPNFGTGLGWNYYSDDVMSSNSVYAYIQNPVPLVSDIEFDNAGNIIIGIMDWSGHRMGTFNYRADPNFTTLHNIQVQGDVIKAIKSGNTWVKENGVGSFYNDMKSVPDQTGWQDDTFMGGMIIADCNGTELVVANTQDPYVLNEGGAVWMKTSDGLMQTNNTGVRVSGGGSGGAIADGSRIRIYQSQDGIPSTFGKAAGLGDMIATYNVACVAPLITSVAIDTATCTNGIANNNAAIFVRGISGMTKYAYRTNATDGLWALTATASTADSIRISNLANPSVATTYTFRIWGADTTCYKDTSVVLQPKTCVVLCPPITIAPVPLPDGAIGQLYSVQVTATGGVAPYRFYWYAGITGSLPNGLSMNASGLVTGVPTTVGSYAVKIVCFDFNNCADSLDPTILPIQCTYPTIGNITADTATCTSGVVNNNAAVRLSGLVNGASYSYGTNGTTGLFAATATTLSGSSINLTGLPSPATATTYTFRIYSIDTTCYNDTTVVLNPTVCPQCSISGTFTQNVCNNNGTTGTGADDYFTVTVSAVSATNGGAGGKYEVVLNGTVLNTGGTAYGTSVTVGTPTTFKSDGSTTYSLTIRDLNIPTCVTPVFTTTASASCSVIPCATPYCIPVTIIVRKN